ncbi:Sigma54 specific transcriptional regulator, Fis family [uncultured delta proteobacterium]|uniref:Sigma54 specific transcriptional regulator, Fis family n=1 Tax=uncultured delta proteobacterium TaxID=34034 RepID=A0A212KDK8_9DELT|nr:Sigma54 specific transcriptional regulator, Fis family [uncultured delta proteobacterium]
MPSILFVSSDHGRVAYARTIFAEEYPDILPMHTPPDSDGSDITAAVMEHGIEVVIGRGAIHSRVKRLDLPVTALEAPVTALDTLHALRIAKIHGSRVAAVASRSVITGVHELSELLGIDLRVYLMDGGRDPRPLVEKAIEDGADAIIGGYMATSIAEEMGHPNALVSNHEEGLRQAAREATEIVTAVREEKRRSGLIRTLIDHTSDGIVAVDAAGKIIVFNPVAASITGVANALGTLADKTLPVLKLMKTLESGKEDLGGIFRINGIDVICQRVPVTVDGKVVAAVATFQDVRRLQQMEARVRRRIYDSGHAATATFDTLLGKSPAQMRTAAQAKEFALTDSTVLLLGETGTGKELLAQSIHNYSSRKKGPFVAINCAALPGQLLESELFGYEGGAFTGANPKGKPGMFELAHGGTLLLDEVGEMDIHIQGKLLRVLEERKIMRLGSDKLLPINVRLITATNSNLRELIRKSAFRADLYYRLNVLRLQAPPLRERREDIPLLAAHFLDIFSAEGKSPPKLAPDAESALQEYHWPGNVRELRNLMERVAALHKRGTIDASTVMGLLADEHAELTPPEYDEDLAKIYAALAECGGNHTRAAKLLGMSRITLWRRLKQKQGRNASE